MILDANFITTKVYAFDLSKVESWWDFRNHISPFARLFLVKEGRQTITFHGQKNVLKGGVLALVPPYTPVHYLCEEYCLEYYFVFSCLLPSGKDIFIDHKFPHSLATKKEHEHICDELYKTLSDFGLQNVNAHSEDFNELIFKRNSKSLTLQQRMQLQGVVNILLSEFAIKVESRKQMIRFAKAFQYIENNLDDELSLEVLSQIEGLSKTYFSDHFAEQVGVRPSDYIAQKRENKARELLTTTNESIESIAKCVGMSNDRYFTRFFKQRVGVTPRRFRLSRLT